MVKKVSIEKVCLSWGKLQIYLLAIPGSRSSVFSFIPATFERERTCAYHQAGYEVRWLLGEELWLNGRLTDLQRDFLYLRLR